MDTNTPRLTSRPPLAVAWSHAIKEQRKALGLTQVELAEACQVEQATISKWERGLISPSAASQSRLVVALAIPQDRWYRIQREGAAA